MFLKISGIKHEIDFGIVWGCFGVPNRSKTESESFLVAVLRPLGAILSHLEAGLSRLKAVLEDLETS